MKVAVAFLMISGVASVGLLAIAAGGNAWISLTKGSVTYTQGLWKICVSTKTSSVCQNLDTNDKLYHAYRALIVLAVLASAAGVFISVLGVAKIVRISFAASAFVVAVVFAAASLGLYAVHVKNNRIYNSLGFNYGWSYILGCLGIVTSVFSVGLAFAAGHYHH